MGIRPPGVKASWDEMLVINQAFLLAYGQIREYEEAKIDAEKAKLIALGAGS